VTSELILNQMQQANKALITRDEVINRLKTKKPGIFLTMGAGDIDLLVDPITKILQA
jgi:UDP-N-acetylmuramate--alanine ligase